jgi:hypothetical protein
MLVMTSWGQFASVSTLLPALSKIGAIRIILGRSSQLFS